MEWFERAACLGHPRPEIFWLADSDSHPDLGFDEIKGINRLRRTAAVTVCNRCPVSQECLDDATAADREVTVRGGQPPKRGGTARGRPSGTSLAPQEREHLADRLLADWIAGYPLGVACARRGVTDTFLACLAWRKRYQIVSSWPDNAWVTPSKPLERTGRAPIRARLLAKSADGQVYSYLRKDARGIARRGFARKDQVRPDPTCGTLGKLVTWD